MSVKRHMFYGLFGTQNSMVTFGSKFDPRKGQCQVKIARISSSFQIHNFVIKTCLSYPVLSQDSKYVIFYARQIEMPEIAFQKGGVITFAWFLGHCKAKNRAVGLGFCMRVVCMYLDNIYSVFYIVKFLDFTRNYCFNIYFRIICSGILL